MGPRFESAPQDEVERLSSWVDEIIEGIAWVLEIPPQMYVTDESRVSDFVMGPERLARLRERLGVEVKEGDLLIDLARRLLAQRQG